MEDMTNDPDFKEFKLLQEQLEFWRYRVREEDLTSEEKVRAEEKCIEILKKSTDALQRFNERWTEISGPLPEVDDETLQFVHNKFAEMGIEVTLDEIKEALDEEV